MERAARRAGYSDVDVAFRRCNKATLAGMRFRDKLSKFIPAVPRRSASRFRPARHGALSPKHRRRITLRLFNERFHSADSPGNCEGHRCPGGSRRSLINAAAAFKSLPTGWQHLNSGLFIGAILCPPKFRRTRVSFKGLPARIPGRTTGYLE